MVNYLIFYLVLGFINAIKCEPEFNLIILKSFGDNYIPVQNATVEERAGSNFSLLCDLVSSKNNTYYDWQISWVKQANDLRFWKEQDLRTESQNKVKKMYSVLKPSDINKAVKRFQPLRSQDRGSYLCVSLKYNLFELVKVIVREPATNARPVGPIMRNEKIGCSSDKMFRCVSTDLCIIRRYICDGKPDCRDGSDESIETCNGEPCKDKLSCDDGRCIPLNWCCDRHHDPNCTVYNRPKCCQLLTNSYEDMEYGLPSYTQTNYNPARYLFISVCIVCISFFIVLLLLVLSKVMSFAKKTALQHNRENNRNLRNIESIALSYHCNGRLSDNYDVSDPLLYTNCGRNGRDEHPPPYIDVVRAQNCTVNLNEPPPPYTSREVINVVDERN